MTWKAGERWEMMCLARRRESIAMIWRKRFWIFAPFLWDIITSHLKARPPHITVFQEVRRTNTGNSWEGIPEVCKQGIEQLQQVPAAHSVSSAVGKELMISPQDMIVLYEFTSAKAHKYPPNNLEPILNGAPCTHDSHSQSTRETCGELWLPGFGGTAAVSELLIAVVSH